MLKKMLPNNPYRATLNLSWKEGIAASIMIYITDYYLIPLGLLLGATPLQIGFQVAVPTLLGSATQLLAVQAVDFLGSRKRFLVRATSIQACVLLPVAAFPFFHFPHRVEIFILLIVLFRILGNLIQTTWSSLISDYLEPEERGRYLGWRSQVTGLSGVAGMILGGIFLFLAKKFSPELGFSLLFLVTSLSRFLSSRLMTRMQDLPSVRKEGSDFTFYQFLARFRESNFVKFVFYVASITFATTVAAPYFSVLMLKDLKFSYLSYMLVHLAAISGGLVGFPIWGKHADWAGNAKVLKITGCLIPLIPLTWLFSTNLFYLMAVEFYSGFVWSGFNLCSVNFIFDAVSPDKRVRCLGYFTFINGTAIFAGASVGGFLAENLPALWGHRLYTLFLLSAWIRLCAYLFLADKFKEVRETAQKISSRELFFSVVGIKPLLGRNQDWVGPPED